MKHIGSAFSSVGPQARLQHFQLDLRVNTNVHTSFFEAFEMGFVKLIYLYNYALALPSHRDHLKTCGSLQSGRHASSRCSHRQCIHIDSVLFPVRPARAFIALFTRLVCYDISPYSLLSKRPCRVFLSLIYAATH